MQVSSTGRGSARIALSLGGSARRQVDHLGLVRDPRPRFQRIAECPELLLGDAVHAHQQIELGDRKQLGRAAEAKRVQRTDVLIGGGDDRLQLLGHVLRLVVARTEEQETLLILPYEKWPRRRSYHKPSLFTRHALRNAKRHERTSVPIPKFAKVCGTLGCELRSRRTLATY